MFPLTLGNVVFAIVSRAIALSAHEPLIGIQAMYVDRSLQRLYSLLLVCTLAACDGGAGAQKKSPPPASVSVQQAHAQPVAVTTDLPGRLEPWRVAEVRARVSGIVQRRLFEEGSDVQAGQTLFQIDEAPYRARHTSAIAGVARAEATLYRAHSQAERSERLLKAHAISEQDYINARADERAAEAEVSVARASLESARIDLAYATVSAPISGRIGRALVTEGALVGQGEATPLATIQQVDRLYVSFTQTAREVLALRQAYAAGEMKMEQGVVPVQLLLEDGTTYPHPGQLLFSDLSVDPDTSRVTLRASLPNPEGLLLPGMYVRVRLQQASYPQAYLVPQQAVVRTERGDTMQVVDEQKHVVARPVTVSGTVANQWVVIKGLKDGDQYVVEGFQKIRPNTPVNPVPWQPPAR